MSFNGYPSLTIAARSAFETWLAKTPDQPAQDYHAEHTLIGKTYKAAAIVEVRVLIGTLPPELRIVADCLKIV